MLFRSAGLDGLSGLGRAEERQASGQGSAMKPISMGWAKETNPQKIGVPEHNLKDNQLGPFSVGTSPNRRGPILQTSPSVRGKKGLARSRAISTQMQPESLNSQNWSWRTSDGSKGSHENKFQFSAPVQKEVGIKAKGKKSDEPVVVSNRRVGTGGGEASYVRSDRPGGSKVGDGCGSPSCHPAEPSLQADSVVQVDPVDRRTHNSKDRVQGDSSEGEAGMDFENDGGVTADSVLQAEPVD